MAESKKCPKCGAELPTNAPAGICPKCLLVAGIESQAPSARGDVATGPFVSPVPVSPSLAASPTLPVPPKPDSPDLERLARQFPQLDDFEYLGQGGMGVVYKARQRQLNRLVAVKILPPSVGDDPAFAERFTREAQALARLNHPNIVHVYDFGRTDEFFYFVMEYVDGVNLRALIRDEQLKPAEALKIVPQICEALQFAHDEGIVHRDVKPENILIDKRGRVKIADFGLAKLLGLEAMPEGLRLTGTGQLMGTLGYMAPEQLQQAHAVDHRADIYSLGVVFYEMLTGKLPIGRFEPPSKKVHVDVRLDEVVLRSLESEPDRRYQHASDVKTDVEAISTLRAGTNPQIASLGRARSAGIAAMPVSMPLLLAIAVMMVLSALAVTAGLVLAGYAVVTERANPGAFWGWMGAAFGCLIGGAGSLAGCWNTYRQMEGREDLMKSPDWTWFDKTVVGYTVLGAAAAVAGLVLYPAAGATIAAQGLWTIGGIVVLQGALLLPIRGLMRRAALAEASREAIREPPNLQDATPHVKTTPPRRWPAWQWALVILGLFAVLFLFFLILVSLMAWSTPTVAPRQFDSGSAAVTPLPPPSTPQLPPAQWSLGPEGPQLAPDTARFWVRPNQVEPVNKALQATYRDYLALEREMRKESTDEQGHEITIIPPFSTQLSALEGRLWSRLDAVLDRNEQNIFRLNLDRFPREPPTGVGVANRDLVRPGLLGWGKDGARIEVWREGTWYRWKVQSRSYEDSATAPQLPEQYRRFWKEPRQKPAMAKQSDKKAGER